jgi:hypothetical protein
MGAYEQAAEARMAAAKAKAAADKATADKAATGFKTTGNVFTDTLNKLRAERGIKAEDVNTSGQLDVYGVTENRIAAAQAVAAKPVMSEEQKAGGGVVKWVGGINGEYQIIMPFMSPLIGSKAAGWESGRNNLAGKPPVATTTLKPGDPGYVAPKGDGDGVTPKAPVGTPPAYVYDPVSKTWKMPAKPSGEGNWVFDANNGWVDTTVNPGSSGFRADGTKTLALDTFKNTLALLFGAKEASQPWVTALYTSASKFYNTGSTVDEAINLSLQDVRYNKDLKPFTDRFNGIYALTDRLAKGEAINVPTVAEYFKSESAMGDVLRSAGMGELATQDFLGGIIGLGKSVLEVTNLITDTFDRIDNAPSALKKDLQAAFPGADRTSIAKAMLLGDKGAAELTKKVKAISVQSAAKTQGVLIDNLTSEDIAGQGYDYNKSLTNFATVKQLERGQTLGRMSNIDLTQQEAIASAFGSNAAADEKIRRIAEEEANRFAARSGKLASRSRAQGAI